MEQCWDADPTKRPDIRYLFNEINEMRRLFYQNHENKEQEINNMHVTNYDFNYSPVNSLVRNLSKIHIYENIPEPKSVTEGKILNLNLCLSKLSYNHVLN